MANPACSPSVFDLGRLVLVRALGPDPLAARERRTWHPRRRSRTRLLAAGSRGASRSRCAPAFQTARCAKASRSNVAAELPVDAHEQVAVERRGHAERIVVGEQQVALRLDEIGAEQQRSRPARARARIARRNSCAAGVSKLPMFEPSSSTSIGCPRRARRAARRRPTS